MIIDQPIINGTAQGRTANALTATTATTALNTTSVTQASQLWVQTNSYVAGALVHRNNLIYRANNNIPANTSFTIGSSGATWTEVSPASTGYPVWTNAGAISFAATTTAPTVSSWARNFISYRQLGSREWAICLIFDKPVGGSATVGNGDYLFTLPAACPDFDLSSGLQIQYQANVGISDVIFNRVMIPTSSGFANHNAVVSSDLGIVPWSARQFRVILHNPGTAIRAWGSGWYPLDGALGIVAQFSYQSV